MQNRPAFLKIPALLLWTVVLALFTAILGAAPLKALRTTIGQLRFWAVGFLLAVGFLVFHLYLLGFVVGAQVILIGTYGEFEDHGLSLRRAAALSVVISSLASASAVFLWAAFTNKDLYQTLISWIGLFLKRAAEMKIPIFEGLKPQSLIYQLPSALVIFLILSLALALILERPISRWAGLAVERKAKLADYKNPDFLIWILILSVLGTFLHDGTKPLQLLSLNVLNISILAYFFQGLGVLGTYFEVFQIGIIWRLLWILILVIQLPIVLSIVGVADYWLEFRQFLMRKAAQLKKKKIGD